MPLSQVTPFSISSGLNIFFLLILLFLCFSVSETYDTPLILARTLQSENFFTRPFTIFILTISAYATTIKNVILYAKLTRKIMLEGYATVQEMAEKWGLNQRTVQTMCASGKIAGLTKFGRSWAIPKDTEKPTDNRVKSGAYKDWRKKYSSNSKE